MIAKIIRFLAPLFGIGVAKVALGAESSRQARRTVEPPKTTLIPIFTMESGARQKNGGEGRPDAFLMGVGRAARRPRFARECRSWQARHGKS